MRTRHLSIEGEHLRLCFEVRGYLHPDERGGEWADVLDAEIVVELGGAHLGRRPALITSAGVEWFKLELEELLAGRRQDAVFEDFDLSMRLVIAAASEGEASQGSFECAGRIGGDSAPELRFAERPIDGAAVRSTLADADRMLEWWPPRFQQFRRQHPGG